MPPRSVLTIGTFDGVHVGHAALVARARDLARPHGGRVVVLAFDPHPLACLRPEQAPPRLTTFTDREALLVAAGADQVIRMEPTAELLAMSAEAFLDQLCRDWSPIAFVEGSDFRFGRGRAGDVQMLRLRGAASGFKVEVVDPVLVALGDHSIAPASSTLARWLLSHGRLADATIVLGRPYELAGTIVRGDRRGRTIGFPTANLRTECLTPADGVYAAEAVLPDGRTFAAAVSIGTKPTFGAGERAVEAWLLDVEALHGLLPGLPEYGWNLRLRLIAWVREQSTFPFVDALVEQVHRDATRVRTMIRPADQLPISPMAPLELPVCP